MQNLLNIINFWECCPFVWHRWISKDLSLSFKVMNNLSSRKWPFVNLLLFLFFVFFHRICFSQNFYHKKNYLMKIQIIFMNRNRLSLLVGFEGTYWNLLCFFYSTWNLPKVGWTWEHLSHYQWVNNGNYS